MGDASDSKLTGMAKTLVANDLTSSWSFKQSDDLCHDAWLPVARVPSVVHQDLMDNQRFVDPGQCTVLVEPADSDCVPRLKDPFIAFNEIDAEWVGEKSWTYRRALQRPLSASKDSTLVLAFDGLDTFAEVRLDGEVILKSDNMFLPQRVDVTKYLQDHESHDLQSRSLLPF